MAVQPIQSVFQKCVTGHVFLRWKLVLLHTFAGHFLAVVFLQHRMHDEEHSREFFFFPSSAKVCFLTMKVTGGIVTKGLT